MSKPVVLIASASSRNGAEAAKLLLAQGKYTVRVAARNLTKLAALVAQGGEPVTLDFNSAQSMNQACIGVDYVYLILPGLALEDEETIFQNFLQAAKSTGIKHVVYLSAASPVRRGPDYKSISKHPAHEQLLLKSGIPFTVVRPTWFYENYSTFHGESIRGTGEFRTSAGDGLWTGVGVGDIAKAVVVIFSDHSKHAGKLYTLETEVLTDKLVAEKISKVVGKKVTHVNLTPEEHKELIKKFIPSEEFADLLVMLDSYKRDSLFNVVRPDLEELLGHKGVTMDEFLAEHADAFKLQPAAA